ncbi:hypothetical protein ACQKWADRAFT_290556 [Trichoderma austrokoningii]
MSGLEVAGAVLGAIPLVISALEHYQQGVRVIQRWRKYDMELQCLIRNIETERIKLQNICEKLLDGLVPPSQIDTMVENPGGDLWMNETVQRKIRSRLWRSWPVFEQTLRDIQKAITDIGDKVGNVHDVRGSDTSLVAKELKRAGFTLRRSTYEGLLIIVKDGVSNLESLAIMNIELEPKRRLRSRVRLLNVLRNLSSSIYRAVCSGLTCACKHRISMRVSDYMDDITPNHDEEYIFQTLQAHLALSLDRLVSEESLSVVADRQWEELLIRASLPLSTPVSKPSLPPDTVKASGKREKVTRFSIHRFSSSSTATIVQTETCLVATRAVMQSSINICYEMNKSPAAEKLGCLGVISDQFHTNPRSYSVYSSTLSSLNATGWRMVSLRDGLESRNGQAPPTYKQRLRLAVLIAKSVLQFYKTPWLAEMPSSRDIFFLQNGNSPDYDRPFLMATSSKGKSKAIDDPVIRNPTLLAIGVLLIELLQGQTIQSLQAQEEALGDGLLSLYMAASRCLREISRASSNYGTAVSRCIDGKIQGRHLDLENEDDRHEIYCGVVALLEEDLDNL